MKLKDVMTHDVQVIEPDAALDEAAELMRRLDAGALPVCDGERLVGMVTDRDLTVRATADGVDPKQVTVRQVMTPDAAYGFDDQDVSDAARIMEEKQIRRLVVLDHDKRLVGIVSLGDLAIKGSDGAIKQEVLEHVSEPSEQSRQP